QAPNATGRSPGATVTGTVHDSLAHAPLGGATVQLVAADSLARFARTAIADSLGNFTLDGVPAGNYTLGFFHPMLDSLGIASPLRQLAVDGEHAMSANLAIPSPARLRAAICGGTRVAAPSSGNRYGSGPDSGAVVVGVVRDARDGSPIAGASVAGDWLELSFGPAGVQRHAPHLVARTGDNGWFAICNVPRSGTMFLTATRGADSTDQIELQIPAEGYARRELYLGASRTVETTVASAPAAATDSAKGRDSLPPAVRKVRLGDGRLSGTVMAAAGGKPLVGAQVGISGGPQARTNDRGEWTISEAPVGTRTLEVRAVGYYPERRRVDVVAGAPPIRLTLSTLKAVLDTVRVTANRPVFDRDSRGFEERRRAGMGRFLSASDIARRDPFFTSDLFTMMSGVRLDRRQMDAKILVRGMADSLCAAEIFLNGAHIPGLTADDIDSFAKPSDVHGIEVYAGTMVPVQYQVALGGCGAIVIWTK
ncbi:MAG: carboxypeptidase regulatory-like domain-containing protein, partial [Gemmatimonadaceae bacterium]|nr:carboxypeptidase regulatory-like domain-containing protein [Gemmatimonadaceae bacterium]